MRRARRLKDRILEDNGRSQRSKKQTQFECRLRTVRRLAPWGAKQQRTREGNRKQTRRKGYPWKGILTRTPDVCCLQFLVTRTIVQDYRSLNKNRKYGTPSDIQDGGVGEARNRVERNIVEVGKRVGISIRGIRDIQTVIVKQGWNQRECGQNC